MGFPDGLVGKESPLMQEMRVWFLDQEDSLEKKVAIHSSALVWEIPWTEDPGGLQSVGSQRVGHDWTTTYNCNKKLNKKEHDFMIYTLKMSGCSCWIQTLPPAYLSPAPIRD